MTQIANARCIVTGGARGMGRLFGERLLRRGCQVALIDVAKDALEETRAQLARLGTVHAFVGDMADGPDVYRVAGEAVDALGGVDLLINNAGVVTGGALTDVSDERHALTYLVNTLGVVRMTRAVLPAMIAGRGGHVVNIASAAGLTAVPLQTTYCSSKWAVVGFSEALALELTHLGHPIGVTTVCPSFVDTGMFEGVKPPMLVPMLRPEDVVDRTLVAVEKDEPMLVMPLMAKQIPWMRAVLPRRLLAFLNDRLGVNRSMETWRGH